MAGWLLLGASCRKPSEMTGRSPRKRILVLTETAGYRHSSIPVAVRTLREFGDETDAWEVAEHADAAEQVARAMTAERLRTVDGVAFASTTGNLSFTPAGRTAFYEWMRRGSAYVGIHSATDTFHGDPDYLELVGSEFLPHGPQVQVTVHVQDAAHPACQGLPDRFEIYDEIYEFQNWSQSRVHTLLSIKRHPQSGASGDFPLAWTKRAGAGGIFYTALGHREDVYANDFFRRHLAGGVLWALGLRSGADSSQSPA